MLSMNSPSIVNPNREIAMAHPVHPYFVPSAAVSTAAHSRRSATVAREHSRTLAGMLLAAVVAAVLVVVDQLINTWVDGHLLVVWVILWSVAFAVLAVLAPTLRQVADRTARRLTGWVAARRQRRAEAALWNLAQEDHRVMQDLYVASLVAEHREVA
jgi:hypothetical protein